MTTARKIAFGMTQAYIRWQETRDATADDKIHPDLEFVALLHKEAREARIDAFDILLESLRITSVYAGVVSELTGNSPMSAIDGMIADEMVPPKGSAEDECPNGCSRYDWRPDEDGDEPHRYFCHECGYNDPWNDGKDNQ